LILKGCIPFSGSSRQSRPVCRSSKVSTQRAKTRRVPSERMREVYSRRFLSFNLIMNWHIAGRPVG
jgi:hypothetical protein